MRLRCKFRRMDAMYAFISTYKAALERGWLEEARESGLSMRIELKNGRWADGPSLTPLQIEKFLARLD